jgi:Zn-finger nucleic acid-binding protein
MNCPRDGAALADAKVDGCRLEKCPQCHGLWFDAGEMERLFNLPFEKVEASVQVLPGAEEGLPPYMAGYMRCPRCIDGRLQGITYTLTNSLRIYRCEKCLGLWLDETELDAILHEEKWLESEYSPEHLREHLTGTRSSHRPRHRA